MTSRKLGTWDGSWDENWTPAPEAWPSSSSVLLIKARRHWTVGLGVDGNAPVHDRKVVTERHGPAGSAAAGSGSPNVAKVTLLLSCMKLPRAFARCSVNVPLALLAGHGAVPCQCSNRPGPSHARCPGLVRAATSGGLLIRHAAAVAFRALSHPPAAALLAAAATGSGDFA